MPLEAMKPIAAAINPEAGVLAFRGVFVATSPGICCDARENEMPPPRNRVQFWEDLWNALLERLQRPLTGVLLSREAARRIGEPVLLRLVRQRDEEDTDASTTSTGLREAALASKSYVADERLLSRDQERHRDPEDRRYEKNLDLPALQQKGKRGSFTHSEWTILDKFLRPFGFQVLRKKGFKDEDGEEVFNDAFASLAIAPRESGPAPIEDLIVFEEIIPNFCRRVGFRAVDSIRRRTAQKARPEHLHSLEGMETEDGSAVQIADRTATDREHPETWRFEDIHRQCREELNEVEWGLIYDLYVAQNYTVKDLVADPAKLRYLGIDSNQSASTLRRRVEEIVNPALARLADALSV